MHRRLASALVIASVCACSGSNDSTDAGSTLPDAGQVADAGAPQTDAGAIAHEAGVDAGTRDGGPDAGSTMDAGTCISIDTMTSLVTLDRTTAAANGTDPVTITISLFDANGGAAMGCAVQLQVSGMGNQVSAPELTNALGITSAVLTSTTAGSKAITAISGGVMLATTPTVDFVMAAAGPVATVTLLATPLSVPADGVSAIELAVTALGASGAAASSEPVTLAGSATGDKFISTDSATDSDGVFTSSLASTTAGMQTVTATVGEATATVDVTFTTAPSPTLTTLKDSPSSVPADGVSTITLVATAVDADSNPIADVPVSLAMPTGLASTPSSGVTSTDGTFTSDVTSTAIGTVLGSATIGAVVKQIWLTFTAVPSPAKSTLTAQPMTAPADGTTGITLTLTVLDANGSAVPDLTVAFAADGTGDLQPTVGTTSTTGFLEITLTSNSVGQLTVKASAGETTIASITVTFT